MSKKQSNTRKIIINPGKVTVSQNIPDHSKDPEVLRKAQHTLQVLKKIGLPPSVRDSIDLDKIEL